MTIDSNNQTNGARISKRRPPRSVITRHSPIIAAAAPTVDGAAAMEFQLKSESDSEAIDVDDQANAAAPLPPPPHDPNEPRSNKIICFYWQWGHCKFGSQCRYQHPPNEFNTVRRPLPESLLDPSFHHSASTKRAQMRIQTLEHELHQLKQDLSNQRQTVAMAQSVLMNVGASIAAASASTSSSATPILLVQPQIAPFQPVPIRPFIQPNYRQRKQRRGAASVQSDLSMQLESGLIANGQPQPVFFPSSLPFQRFGASAHAVAPQAELATTPRQGNKRKPSSPPVMDGYDDSQQQEDTASIAPIAEVRRSGRKKSRGKRRH